MTNGYICRNKTPEKSAVQFDLQIILKKCIKLKKPVQKLNIGK